MARGSIRVGNVGPTGGLGRGRGAGQRLAVGRDVPHLASRQWAAQTLGRPFPSGKPATPAGRRSASPHPWQKRPVWGQFQQIGPKVTAAL